MSALTVRNIRSVFGRKEGPCTITIEDGIITALDKKAPDSSGPVIDAAGLIALPGFVECHTHLLFAGSRENEFYMRAAGRPYLEILREGGGIHSTVSRVRAAGEDELFQRGLYFLDQALQMGITTVEIKSGYGLDYDSEEKMLRVINRLNESHPVDIIPTLLIHSVPRDRERADYLREVETRMIPELRPLAEWFDIFLEEGVFSVSEAETLILAAQKEGYRIGLHINQVHDLGGVELAVRLGARHVDHLEVLSDKDAEMIRNTPGLYPVFLPTAEGFVFSERIGQIAKLLDLGDRIVLSSDFNPGSSPVLSPFFVMTYAVLRYRISDPVLLLNSYTRNPAALLGLEDRGEITVGRKADMLLLELDNFAQIPYLGTFNVVRYVIKNGEVLKQPG